MVDTVQKMPPGALSRVASTYGSPPAVEPGESPAGGPTFAETLQNKAAGGLTFSAHVQARLRARDISLSDQDHASLAQAVAMAGAKGAQESLILFDDVALIVSVKNKTVITALERGDAQANVFTHIDSAVVLPRNRIDKSA